MALIEVAAGASEIFGPEILASFLGDGAAEAAIGGIGSGLAGAGGDIASGLAETGYGASEGLVNGASYNAAQGALQQGASSIPWNGLSGPLSNLAGNVLSPLLGGLASNMIGANGARNSANTLSNAATQAIAMQQGMFNSSQANLQPFIGGGSQAMGQLNSKLSDGTLGGTFSPSDFLANKDPGYQFQLNQGNQALQNSQAAKDGVLGGSALKGLIDYNQGMASTGYQSAYNRWLQSQQNTYGQLAGTAGIGETAAGYGATSAAKFADAIGNNITGRGSSIANGQVGVANNYGKAVSGIGNTLYSLSDLGQQNQQNQDPMNSIVKQVGAQTNGFTQPYNQAPQESI